MKRLPMTIGMLAAGLLVGVLPPAVASATPNPASSPEVQSKLQQIESRHYPNPPGVVDGKISISAMHEMQTKMQRLTQLSQQATAVVSLGKGSGSVSKMAKGLKDNS
jgi:hypothetical protein